MGKISPGERGTKSRIRICQGVLLIAVLSACDTDSLAPPQPDVAPSLQTNSITISPPGAADNVQDQYIVVFTDDVADTHRVAEQLVRTHGGQLHYVYTAVLNGFGATLPQAAAQAISRNPLVDHVSPAQQIRTVGTQSNPPWGLDRVDQRSLPLSGTYTYFNTGNGVRGYIVDTGIRTSHNDFGGRASVGFDAFGGNGQDCNGHGTHVAGIAGGSTYGVAKGISLISVRVFRCNNTSTTLALIAGLDWIRINHVKPAVANASVAVAMNGVETTDPDVDAALNNLINSGVTVVVAAGNQNHSACNVSPARVANAITTGATNSSDSRWVSSASSGSNFGTCLDLFGPGEDVPSTYAFSDTDTRTVTGTSMATPHVTGVAAQYLERYPLDSPSTVRNSIVNRATTGSILNIGTGSPNRLVYSGWPLSVYMTGPQYIARYQSAQYSANATGLDPFSYQWRSRDYSPNWGWSAWTGWTSIGGYYDRSYTYASVNSCGITRKELEVKVTDSLSQTATAPYMIYITNPC